MSTILKRLEHEPTYCEHSDARQLRRDAAEHIRCLESELLAERRKSQQLEALLQRRASEKVSRRAA